MIDDKLIDYLLKNQKMQLVILAGGLGTRGARRNRISPQTSS
jgi:O-methyltransferase involved in polyketide biosynthesis